MARLMGQPLMPWQQLVADVGLEIDERTGLPAYREIVVTVPRQSGKTTLVLAVEVDRALGFGKPQLIIYTAQDGGSARKKLIEDQVPVLERSQLRPTIQRVYRANDNTGLAFVNGSRVDVMASSESAGHGRSPDFGVIDEAFSDVDARREQALIPGMATKADGQLFIVSTAGTDDSVYLRKKVETGRAMAAAGERSGIAYFEWSAPDDAPADDESVWWGCMPALGHTVSIEVVRHAHRSMPEGEFRRAFLNQWTSSDERVIPLAVWEAVCDPSARPVADVCFAVDVNPERTMGAIAAAGAGRGRAAIELVEHRPGTGWVVSAVAALVRAQGGIVAVDATGPAGSLVPELEAAGVEVVSLNGGDLAKACGSFFDDVADREVEIRSHPSLDAAVAGATRRSVGDAWAWARKTTQVDVSPLVASTVALWAAKSLLEGPSIYEGRGLVVL